MSSDLSCKVFKGISEPELVSTMGVSNTELSRLEDSRRLEPDSLSNPIPHSSLGIVRQYEI